MMMSFIFSFNSGTKKQIATINHFDVPASIHVAHSFSRKELLDSQTATRSSLPCVSRKKILPNQKSHCGMSKSVWMREGEPL
jgi:hypothetical protein